VTKHLVVEVTPSQGRALPLDDPNEP
jgi:hypothetical protein